jgi:type II secretory pathway component PulF
MLNEEIAAMARAGLPLDRGLQALAHDMGHRRFRRMTEQLASDLHGGLTLPQALERQAGRVPEYYAALVTAGVRTGRLGEVLTSLTQHARLMADLRTTVVSAMIYPMVVLVLALGLLAAVAYVITPPFKRIFGDFGIDLPAVTVFVLSISDHPFTVGVGFPLSGAAIFGLLWFSMSASDGGRRALARLLYSIPVIGALIRASRMATFTRLLGMLVEQAIPLPEAFRLAGAATTDPLMTQAAALIERDLTAGLLLPEALRRCAWLPEFLAWMTALGDRRGTLAASLRQTSEVYQRQAELRSGLFRNLFPPLLIVLTAGVGVGFLVLALFAPLIKLITELTG